MTHSQPRSDGPVPRRRRPLGANPFRPIRSFLQGLPGLPALLALALALTLAACEQRQPAATGAPAAQGPVQQEAQQPTPARPRVAAREAYRNVPVLGELDSAEFDRTMQALTAWVAPQAGCSHCHVAGDDASDAKPAKATARRMLQMVQHLNNNWKPHVGSAGVTCQACHQGQPRPAAATALVQVVGAAGATGAVSATGTRMLNDINRDFLAGGTQAACSQCHSAGSPVAVAQHGPARLFPALTLLPTEPAEPQATAVAAAPAPPAGPAGPAGPTGPDACARAAIAAVKAGTRLTSAQGQRPVLGDGALPLFSAPDGACALLDLHLRAGDTVEAYVAHAGYTSVRYRRAATGSEARGWVRSERLGPAVDATAGAGVAVPAGLAALRSANGTTTALAAARPAGCNAASEPPAGQASLNGRGRVLGRGRLQFFAVPDAACPMRGIFILPGEPVETLQRSAGFIAVAYVNPRTGGRATGWVTAERVGPTNEAPTPLWR